MERTQAPLTIPELAATTAE